MRTGSEVDIAYRQSGELACSQPGLAGKRQHRSVASTGPGALVRCVKERVDLLLGEVGDHRAVKALGRHGKHTLDDRCVLGVAQRRVTKQ